MDRCIVVDAFLAGHIAGNWTKIRTQGRRGAFNVLSVAFQDEVLPQETLGFIHSDCTIGDPNSLSDNRLKDERTLVSGQQAQTVLSQIEAYTYDRNNIGERRLGRSTDQIGAAIEELAIDNATRSKWHNGGEYKTLGYSRLVNLLSPAVNHLSQQVADLQSKVNGANN